MNKESYAFHYYDDMIFNYAKFLKGGVGSKAAYGRFINAATALAKLQLKNPFELEDECHNSVTRPDGIHTVTAVVE